MENLSTLTKSEILEIAFARGLENTWKNRRMPKEQLIELVPTLTNPEDGPDEQRAWSDNSAELEQPAPRDFTEDPEPFDQPTEHFDDMIETEIVPGKYDVDEQDFDVDDAIEETDDFDLEDEEGEPASETHEGPNNERVDFGSIGAERGFFGPVEVTIFPEERPTEPMVEFNVCYGPDHLVEMLTENGEGKFYSFDVISISEDGQVFEPTYVNGEIVKRGRGRPKGSKNRVKVPGATSERDIRFQTALDVLRAKGEPMRPVAVAVALGLEGSYAPQSAVAVCKSLVKHGAARKIEIAGQVAYEAVN